MCYTNHALDQFLEGILKFCGANELVRIGGKSQCETLEKFNLASIKSNMKKKQEVPTFIHKGRLESNYRLKQIQEEISELERNVKHITDSVLGYELERVIGNINSNHYMQLITLANGRGLSEGILNWLGYAVTKNIQENNENIENNAVIDTDIALVPEEFEEPEMDEEDVKAMERERIIDESSDEYDDDDNDHRATLQLINPTVEPININNVGIIDEDADGFQLTKKDRKKLKQKIKHEIKKSETMPEEQARLVANIEALLPNDRWNLYRLWIKLYVQQFEGQIKVHRNLYRTECLRFEGLRKQEDIEIVKKAKIIGMTTTGAAKYRHIIDGTKPTITSKA